MTYNVAEYVVEWVLCDIQYAEKWRLFLKAFFLCSTTEAHTYTHTHTHTRTHTNTQTHTNTHTHTRTHTMMTAIGDNATRSISPKNVRQKSPASLYIKNNERKSQLKVLMTGDLHI